LKIELNDPKPGKGIQAERPLQFPAKKQLSTRRFMLPTLDLRRLKMGGKKVIIIGAGIAGLSLGCYLQKSGFLTEIYEANGRAGGLCSALVFAHPAQSSFPRRNQTAVRAKMAPYFSVIGRFPIARFFSSVHIQPHLNRSTRKRSIE
jgi:hypothetical protein